MGPGSQRLSGEVVALRWPCQCVGEALSKQVGAQGGGVQRELILKFRDSPRRRRTRWYGEEWGRKRRKRMDSVGCLTDPKADSCDQCSAGLNVPS